MATIEEAIYAHLIADSGVSALVSTRIYPLMIPQDIALPAIAYQRISGPRQTAHDGPIEIAAGRFQITCQGTSYGSAKDVANAVRQALDGYAGPVVSGAESVTVEGSFLKNEWDGYEFAGETRVVRLDFMIYYQEDINGAVLGLDGVLVGEV